MMRVLVVIGTRPEAIKCFPVVDALRRRAGLEVIVCATAQHRHILDQVMRLVGLKADFDLSLMRAEPTLTDITGDVLRGLGAVLKKTRPSRVLVQGDTTTTMATALAAFYQQIPLGHIEAGLRTGSLRSPWPEEANRRIVGALADLHFAPTQQARTNLLKENVPPDRVHVTGNTAIDALLTIKRRLEAKDHTSHAIKEMIAEARAHNRRLILITAHRRENWGEGIRQICSVARGLARRRDVQIVIPVHPNPNVRGPIFQELLGRDGISLLKPLDYLSFVDLMRRCHLILTDSGGVQEEAPALAKPVLVLRDTTERPEGVATGAARLVGVAPERVIAEAERLLDHEDEYRSMSQARNPYGDGNAANRIAAIVAAAAPPGRRVQRRSRGTADACAAPTPLSG
jgi:UDP-N-acetylglucosamine 2-epimerase (non-hydrolysing)